MKSETYIIRQLIVNDKTQDVYDLGEGHEWRLVDILSMYSERWMDLLEVFRFAQFLSFIC